MLHSEILQYFSMHFVSPFVVRWTFTMQHGMQDASHLGDDFSPDGSEEIPSARDMMLAAKRPHEPVSLALLATTC